MSATNFRESAKLAATVARAAGSGAYTPPAVSRPAIGAADLADQTRNIEKTFYRELRDAILAGPDAGQEHTAACNSLADGLLEAPGLHELFRTALSAGPALTGAAFQELIGKAMRRAAEAHTERELKRFAD